MKIDKKLMQAGLEQLAEKQIEEIDRMQAKRYGLPLQTHTDPDIGAQVMSDLFSELPVEEE